MVIPLLGVYPEKIKTLIGKELCTPMLIAALLKTTRIPKLPQTSWVVTFPFSVCCPLGASCQTPVRAGSQGERAAPAVSSWENKSPLTSPSTYQTRFCISVTRTEPRGPLQIHGKLSGTVLGWTFREDRLLSAATDLPLKQGRLLKLRSSGCPKVENWLHLVESRRLPPEQVYKPSFKGEIEVKGIQFKSLFSASSCFLPPIWLVLPILL